MKPRDKATSPLGEATTGPHEEQVAASLRAHAHEGAAADPPAWANYDIACSQWRQRVDTILMDLLASPKCYIARRMLNYRRRYGREPPGPWIRDLEDALDTLRAQLLEMALPNQNAVDLANEICGYVGGQPRATSIIRELCHGRWLPMPPISPALAARRTARPAITDEQRLQEADANAAGWTGQP